MKKKEVKMERGERRVGKNPGIGRFRDPGSGSGFPGESRGIPFFKFVEIKEKIV